MSLVTMSVVTRFYHTSESCSFLLAPLTKCNEWSLLRRTSLQYSDRLPSNLFSSLMMKYSMKCN